MTHIRILEPASQPDHDALTSNLARLRESGLSVSYDATPRDSDWPLNAGSAAQRAQRINAALTDDTVDLVLAARGGYGVSDVLPMLDWHTLKHVPAKPVIGFSDVCALHSALYAQLGWAGLHAPMPGSTLFGQHNEDIDALIQCLLKPPPWHGSIDLRGLNGDRGHLGNTVDGWLYGGCLAVISNLIGTPFMPRSLDGAIVFLEDVGEAPGRIARYFAQWQQSGALDGVAAIVLGAFTQVPTQAQQHTDFHTDVENEKAAKTAAIIHSEIERRASCPVFSSAAFGHVSPNMPLAIGAHAQINDQKLSWQLTDFQT